MKNISFSLCIAVLCSLFMVVAGTLYASVTPKIAAGRNHSIVLKSDGTVVWAWGSNWAGQLGDGTFVDRNNPVQVNVSYGVIAIAAGSGHSMH